jgi:hypothetical protein
MAELRYLRNGCIAQIGREFKALQIANLTFEIAN